jgi:hypothetical protein
MNMANIIFDSVEDGLDWELARKAIMKNKPKSCWLNGNESFMQMCAEVAKLLACGGRGAIKYAEQICKEFIDTERVRNMELRLEQFRNSLRAYDEACPDILYVMLSIIFDYQRYQKRDMPQIAPSLLSCYELIPKGENVQVREEIGRLIIKRFQFAGTCSTDYYIYRMRTDKPVEQQIEGYRKFAHKIIEWQNKNEAGYKPPYDLFIATFINSYCNDVGFNQFLSTLDKL